MRPSRASAVALGIVIADIPGIAAIVRSAFENAGINFSLKRSATREGLATVEFGEGLAETSFGCAPAAPASANKAGAKAMDKIRMPISKIKASSAFTRRAGSFLMKGDDVAVDRMGSEARLVATHWMTIPL